MGICEYRNKSSGSINGVKFFIVLRKLQLARIFCYIPPQPQLHVLFMAWHGEEFYDFRHSKKKQLVVGNINSGFVELRKMSWTTEEIIKFLNQFLMTYAFYSHKIGQ